MSDGIYSAMSGAMARSTALDVVGNNVANAPTSGFRADSIAFREVPAGPPGEPPRTDVDMRMATVDAVVPSWRPGPLQQTGNALDIAIEGDGLLSVQTEQGIRYVRGGALMLDRDGTLMTAGGHPLLDPEGLPIQLPLEGNPIISEDGSITVDEMPAGQLSLVWFESPAVLSREGDNLFAAAPGAQRGEPEGSIRQGSIEGSNMNVVRGMIDMVTLSRSYEATIKAIETFHNIDQRTARDLGKG